MNPQKKMIKFRQKIYTQWDQTDRLKQMKDSDILAEKQKSNTGTYISAAKNAVLGAGIGGTLGGIYGGLKKNNTLARGGKRGAILGGLAAGTISLLGSKKQRSDNEFFNNRLEYAKTQALRREKKDWKNNMTNREGYTY